MKQRSIHLHFAFSVVAKDDKRLGYVEIDCAFMLTQVLEEAPAYVRATIQVDTLWMAWKGFAHNVSRGLKT